MQREGLIRINVNELVGNTELSFLPEDNIARKIYIKSVDLTLRDDIMARDMGKKTLP